MFGIRRTARPKNFFQLFAQKQAEARGLEANDWSEPRYRHRSPTPTPTRSPSNW